MNGKVIRQMLMAQVLSAMTVSLCLLIDNVIINRYLGLQAVAAYELSNPVLLAVGAVASILASGVQVVCSKSLGSGSREETNKAYSSAIAIAGAISIPVTVIVFLLRSPIARLVGADASPELMDHTVNYLAGFVIGAPPTMAALALIPFLQIAGKSKLLIVAVLAMTVTDVGLDLLNVMVLNGGMLGMGLASSISYYVALGIALFYFLSPRKCVFRFSRKLVSLKKVAELFRGGMPNAFTMIAGVLMVFVMNHLLLGAGGHTAVAAFAIISGILNISNSVSSGMNGVTLTLTGILYGEEDRNGIQRLIPTMIRYGLVLGAGAAALFALAAPALVGIFLKDPGPTRDLAILGVRLTSLGLLPCCVVNVFKSYYQGTERIPQMAVVAMLEGFALATLSAVILNGIWGIRWIWLYFFAGQCLTLACVFCYELIRRKGGRQLLQADFGVAPENAMEVRITSMEQVMEVSRQAEEFCLAHGGDETFAHRIALCVEEMAGNTVTHGFRGKGKNDFSVRIQCKEGKWILRFRDDCRAFDPVNYVPGEDREDGLGIRLVLGMADDVRYTYSLSLNNLMILLKTKTKAAS